VAPTRYPTERTIRLAELSIRLDLDLDEIRQGLAVAMDTARDISVTPHPETAARGDPLQIVVDWDRFDAERITIIASPPDDDS
jgi:hypothetical protein